MHQRLSLHRRSEIEQGSFSRPLPRTDYGSNKLSCAPAVPDKRYGVGTPSFQIMNQAHSIMRMAIAVPVSQATEASSCMSGLPDDAVPGFKTPSKNAVIQQKFI